MGTTATTLAAFALAGALALAAAACTTIEVAPQAAVTKTATPTITPTPTPTTPAPTKVIVRHRTKTVYVPAAPVQTDPWAVVSEYYGDVSSGDYASGWNLLGPSFQARQGSYQNWVAGYDGTGAQQVQEVGESGSAVSYYLTSANPDGTVQYYSGTAVVYGGLIQSTSVTQLAGNPQS